MWELECPQCGKTLKAPEHLVGRRVKCPQCAHPFLIEEPAEEEPEPELEVLPLAPPTPLRKVQKAIDDWRAGGTVASLPGGFSLSREKLETFYPNFFSPVGFLIRLIKTFLLPRLFLTAGGIESHLRLGDCSAAVVITTAPLLVASYTGERDCVVLLKFPEEFVGDYSLKPGTRLVSVNTYMQGPNKTPLDMIEGPQSAGRWHNVVPLIADFLSDDTQAIAQRKRQIPEAEWRRAATLGVEFTNKFPGKSRNGSPQDSWKPCITAWF